MFGIGLPELLALLVFVALVVGVAFYASLARERVRTAQAETRRIQAVLDDVKEVAWSNRDIAPDLSTIVIDTIRSAERSNRPELPG